MPLASKTHMKLRGRWRLISWPILFGAMAPEGWRHRDLLRTIMKAACRLCRSSHGRTSGGSVAAQATIVDSRALILTNQHVRR